MGGVLVVACGLVFLIFLVPCEQEKSSRDTFKTRLILEFLGQAEERRCQDQPVFQKIRRRVSCWQTVSFTQSSLLSAPDSQGLSQLVVF